MQSEEKCSVILQSTSIPYQNYAEVLLCNLFILQLEDASDL